MTSNNTKSPNSQLRETAETQLANQPLTEVTERSSEELLHELHVYQIELEMQNETLRQTQIELQESRDRYVNLYEFAPVGYLILSEEGMITEANLMAVTLLGKERKKLLKRSFSTLIAHTDQDRWVRHFIEVKKQDKMSRIELEMLHGNGSVIQVQLDCVGNGASVRITLTDITSRKLLENELRIAAVAFSCQNGMMITDSKGIIVRVNPAFTKLTGYTPEEAIGHTVGSLLKSGRQGQPFYHKMWHALKYEGGWQGEIWNKRKDGQIYPEMLIITAIYSSDGIITNYVGSFTDITESKKAEAEIHELAFYDPLTKLPNRRLLQDRLNKVIDKTARSRQYGALFFIDIDNFKTLNDTRGHGIGDLLLIEIANRLREDVRKMDSVARQGGDEFVVLIDELGSTIDESVMLATYLGNKLHKVLTEPFNLNGLEYHCKVSIGVSLFDGNCSVEELFKQADMALYDAKNRGRNQLCFFDPTMQQLLEQYSNMETDLRNAIARQELKLYYQPQINTSRQIVGVEALLRWQHPRLGLVSPDDFIPLAEETWLILPIGRWVLETACAQIKQWESDPLTSKVKIAVNVSARQFHQLDFVGQVRSVLAESGANPARLKLELTESMMLEDAPVIIAKMQEIRQLNVLFSMDDFGTGYSSLSYLTQLPLNQLKIDKAFVRNMSNSKNDETITRAIVAMGLGLNMNVIAEGVETEAQCGFLEALGCTEYQGYLFSRALPIEELEKYLHQYINL
jgi:diguanylate cyclase (GGDEF)-like protein/PAS domain S-box-containing protein